MNRKIYLIYFLFVFLTSFSQNKPIELYDLFLKLSPVKGTNITNWDKISQLNLPVKWEGKVPTYNKNTFSYLLNGSINLVFNGKDFNVESWWLSLEGDKNGFYSFHLSCDNNRGLDSDNSTFGLFGNKKSELKIVKKCKNNIHDELYYEVNIPNKNVSWIYTFVDGGTAGNVLWIDVYFKKADLKIKCIYSDDEELTAVDDSNNSEVVDANYNSNNISAVTLTNEAALLFAESKSKLSNVQKNQITQLCNYSELTKMKNVKLKPYPVDMNNDGIEEIFVHIHTKLLGIGSNEYYLFLPDSRGGFRTVISNQKQTMRIVDDKFSNYPDILIGKVGLDRDLYRWNGVNYQLVKKVTFGESLLYKQLTIEEVSQKYSNKP